MARRWLLVAVPVLALSACGFQLRQAPQLAFHSLVLNAPASSLLDVDAKTISSLAQELKQSLLTSDGLRVVTEASQFHSADVVLDLISEQREKVVVGLNASGQVREFQLRLRLKFRLRTPKGKELIPDTELVQQRDISYTETLALAKEVEEAQLYRSMQTDLVQQVLRRLAAVRQL
jgi:LPS-assembly lipoprotein